LWMTKSVIHNNNNVEQNLLLFTVDLKHFHWKCLMLPSPFHLHSMQQASTFSTYLFSAYGFCNDTQW
jgi:hypothetical protein